MMKYTYISLILSVLISGCAFSKAKLDVRYDEATVKQGPLSSVSPVKVKIEPIEDNRQIFDKIGYVKNGYGMNCADIVTQTPVPDIIYDGLVIMLQKNGHEVIDQDADIVISGMIERFWFESQMNFWTIEFMGTADLTLEVKDALNGEVLLNKSYTGHHNEELFSGYHKEMQLVMNQTLEDLIIHVSMDSQLVEALSAK